MTDFRALIEALCKSEVRFVLVGGVAATLHGSARLTQDVDIVYARDSDNLARIVRALAPLQPYLRGAPSGLRHRPETSICSARSPESAVTTRSPVTLSWLKFLASAACAWICRH